MLVNSRQERNKITDLLDQWSDWVYHENRGELRALGIKSWLGEIVKNNNVEKNTYHEPVPVMDLSQHDEKMTVIDNAVKSLPVLQRQTIVIEFLVRRKDRKDVRSRWLQSSGRNYSSHRKMLSTVKDLLWLTVKKHIDK